MCLKFHLMVGFAMLAVANPLIAETVRWDVEARFGMNASGLQQAIDAAKRHFAQSPDDTVILELSEGNFWLERKQPGKGTLDLSGVKPGANGRLVFQGKGIDKTVLTFADDKHALFGRNVFRVTFTQMHMTRKKYTVSQGKVVKVQPGKVVLDIQNGFPTPDAIYNSLSKQGRFMRKYTNSRTDPHLVEKNNEQIPWKVAKHVGGQRWRLELKNKNLVANYRAGDLIGIKSKHSQGDEEWDGQTYWLYSGADVRFEKVKWTHKSRGVFRGGFQKVQFVDCLFDRAPPINGQTPCLAAPGGGPQIGQPNDPPTNGHLIRNCRFIALGDDAIAFFNATGEITDCYIRDSFVRGILVANGPNTVLERNQLIRCPVQVSKDWKFQYGE